MSATTIPPALLTAGQLAEIDAERAAAFECAVDYNINSAGRQYLRDTGALLTHIDAQQAVFDAYRAQVAEQLRGLLTDCAFLGESGKRLVAEKNAPIHAAAKALNIEL